VLMNRDFWRGRRVFVTGHTGFKGSWLALWLKRLGAEVVGYSLPVATEPSLFEVASVGAEIESVMGDVRDLELLCATMQAARPEIVLHLAAQSLVHHGYRHPVETFGTNVMGTVNVLEAARTIPSLRSMVIVTTDKCYENRELPRGYRESDRLGGHDPYSSSKACAELVTSAYRSSYFTGKDEDHPVIATARGGNAIGGGDWAEDRLIPDLITGFVDGTTVAIRNPTAVRPWQHVLELLSGYLLLAERLAEEGVAYAGGWNFGPNAAEARPVSWVVERIRSVWADGAEWQMDAVEHPHETNFLSLDTTKASDLLDWKPRLRLGTAIEWTVDWYRSHAAGEDPRSLCERQFEMYEERCGEATRSSVTESAVAEPVPGPHLMSERMRGEAGD
jgi:CDP-glucose 4,6-dehydratase